MSSDFTTLEAAEIGAHQAATGGSEGRVAHVLSAHIVHRAAPGSYKRNVFGKLVANWHMCSIVEYRDILFYNGQFHYLMNSSEKVVLPVVRSRTDARPHITVSNISILGMPLANGPTFVPKMDIEPTPTFYEPFVR